MKTTFKSLQQRAQEFGITLTETQLVQFERYHHLLIEWNTRANLTSVTEHAEVETRHFLESLAISQVVPLQSLESANVVDVGSGAGFPGVPLAIAFPNSHVTLVEATAKKTQFLTHLQESLDLKNVSVVTGRAEELAHQSDLRESFDLVLARAVAKLAPLAELTLPFCRIGGSVVLHKGPDVADELASARQAVETLGGNISRTVPMPQLHTTFVVISKERMTPRSYPRRAGIPTKRPL
ncbi:MAG: 16S rRNA (guanine(527)-N(7))-methyltransferase RsmG [Chloroflexi bacterium]|nr:16S rRNA (guanine(527)-N(7))-methyltransferase RsmG [Chloroflexota bacterium]